MTRGGPTRQSHLCCSRCRWNKRILRPSCTCSCVSLVDCCASPSMYVSDCVGGIGGERVTERWAAATVACKWCEPFVDFFFPLVPARVFEGEGRGDTEATVQAAGCACALARFPAPRWLFMLSWFLTDSFFTCSGPAPVVFRSAAWPQSGVVCHGLWRRALHFTFPPPPPLCACAGCYTPFPLPSV